MGQGDRRNLTTPGQIVRRTPIKHTIGADPLLYDADNRPGGCAPLVHSHPPHSITISICARVLFIMISTYTRAHHVCAQCTHLCTRVRVCSHVQQHVSCVRLSARLGMGMAACQPMP